MNDLQEQSKPGSIRDDDHQQYHKQDCSLEETTPAYPSPLMDTFFTAFCFADATLICGLSVRVQMAGVSATIFLIHDDRCPDCMMEERSGV